MQGQKQLQIVNHSVQNAENKEMLPTVLVFSIKVTPGILRVPNEERIKDGRGF